MGIILEILNIKKNKADKTDMLYRQGIRFESAKDKHYIMNHNLLEI